ncbi:MAG TPA: hypothetical protein VIC27_02775, partial [Ktedonobacterales bacterium]
PSRPALLFAWLVGVASLIGVPLFAGFAPLHIISAQALTGPRLSIPLIGVAWVGSALLAIALVRATAPAYSAPLIAIATPDDTAHDADAEAAASEHDDETQSAAAPELRIEELPAIALGVLALLIGLAPGVALTLASGAAGAALQAGALTGLVASSPSGYVAGVGQWFATAPVIFVIIVALVLAYLRTRMPRDIRPLYLAGQTAGQVAGQTAGQTAGQVVPAATHDAENGVENDETGMNEDEPAELVSLSEPTDVWSDLVPALRSGWMTPAAAWLGLNGEDGSAEDDSVEAEAIDAAGEESETPDAEQVGATASATVESAPIVANGPVPLNSQTVGAPASDAAGATGEQV